MIYYTTKIVVFRQYLIRFCEPLILKLAAYWCQV
jgi:hypothetical protein